MNILITSIGQRGYLVDHFKENAVGELSVYTADATKYAPGHQNGDKAFVIPMADAPDYYEKLLKLCLENSVDGIVSINDLELPILAKHRDKLKKQGICAVVSNEDIINICFDKYETYLFCKKNGLSVPLTFLYHEKEEILRCLAAGKLAFPLIAKPRKGSRSVGIHLVESLQQLEEDIELMRQSALAEDEKLMFQEYIDSDQYSVHVFNNSECRPVSVVTMVNIFKHFGETYHIKTIRDQDLIALGERIGARLKHFGPLSADVHRRANGEYVILEFNPRLSGCYSLSHFAGADFTGKICKLVKGEPLACETIAGFADNVIMLKQFTTSMVTQEQINGMD